MSAVSEGITSADVIVWGEGGTFAQQIAVGRRRLKGDEPDSVGGTDTAIPLRLPARRSGFLHLDDGRDVCAKKELAVETSHGLASTFEDIRCRLRRM